MFLPIAFIFGKLVLGLVCKRNVKLGLYLFIQSIIDSSVISQTCGFGDFVPGRSAHFLFSVSIMVSPVLFISA